MTVINVMAWGVLLSLLLTGCPADPKPARIDAHQALLDAGPEQCDTHEAPFFMNGLRINPVKHYRVAARIMSVLRHDHDDALSQVSPVDLLFAWRRMAQPDLTRKEGIRVSQSGRFAHWYDPGLINFSKNEIDTSIANTHLLASDPAVAEALAQVKPEEYVYLEGELVDVVDQEHLRQWKTSLSRSDTGPGACEIFLVKKIERLHVV